MAISVDHFQNDERLADALFVRAEVFQKEQGIPSAVDYDEFDTTAEQFVAYDDEGSPVGTARYRVVSNEVGKVERVAVLATQRGKKVGHSIMQEVQKAARQQELTRLVLDSQLSAAAFYESLGYQQVGDVFDEVGIPHVKMTLDL
jgi:predicted GNAT family N-acyltransferase